MEATMAREIYKRMEIGKEYTTSDLFRMIEDVYYHFIPVELQGKNVNKIVSSEMWKVVKSGYAKTFTEMESLECVRGIHYGSGKRGQKFNYTFRYWVRTR